MEMYQILQIITKRVSSPPSPLCQNVLEEQLQITVATNPTLYNISEFSILALDLFFIFKWGVAKHTQHSIDIWSLRIRPKDLWQLLYLEK